jgi:hypothetical protein
MQGVGTLTKINCRKLKLGKKCKPKRLSLGLLTMIEEERRVRYQIPQLGRSFLEVLWPQMGSTSSFLVQICKKPASKACWKSCKITRKTQIISVSNNRNFLCKKSASKYIY